MTIKQSDSLCSFYKKATQPITFDDAIDGEMMHAGMQSFIDYLTKNRVNKNRKAANILVRGASGTGKSLFLACLSTEIGAKRRVIEPSDWMIGNRVTDEFFQSYISTLLNDAGKKRPCVICLDNVGKLDSSNLEYILKQALGMGGCGVYATQRCNRDADRELSRYFDKTLQLALPDMQRRHRFLINVIQSFDKYASESPYSFNLPAGPAVEADLRRIARESAGLSYIDLSRIIAGTIRRAYTDNRETISTEELLNALYTITGERPENSVQSISPKKRFASFSLA